MCPHICKDICIRTLSAALLRALYLETGNAGSSFNSTSNKSCNPCANHFTVLIFLVLLYKTWIMTAQAASRGILLGSDPPGGIPRPALSASSRNLLNISNSLVPLQTYRIRNPRGVGSSLCFNKPSR